ncbi:hypothetical protein B296_00014780 [Ensete ventricosum]|uniref:Glycoside hydrolase family 3 C-terminal domain-containing protein n=1 Tax=Ensete ventricosum TaxID=4639 RepID=A0A427ARI7_ENSVE|nr:hypothetical protein B296_00014780 [Ensete ventricosum]
MANELLPPYRDATQPVESRVRDLLSRMTLREKAAQMTQIERRVASPSALSGLPVGSVLSAGGSAPRERASPRDWADMIDRMQHWALASRLGIPILYASDAVHGHNNLYGATIFPHNVALGAIRYEKVLEDLVFLVESGRISMSRIDDAVERILRVKFVVGLFEYPFSDRSLFDVVGCKRCPSEATFSDQEYSYAIVAIGEDAYAEFLGDRTELGIPFDGATMISLVAGKVPTVVIVISGRPLVLEPELLDKIDALVAAWLPGSEGGGVADVLFGDYDFEGVLPVTWFKSADQLPMNAGHNAYDPLFPLGYGLRR